MPLAVALLIVLWRSGIRDGMFAYAVIAVVAPLATGSAMSLPRFLMGTFPYAVAAGILLDRMDARLRALTLRAQRRRARVLHVGDLSPERRRASLAGAAGSVAGVIIVFADLKRRRDDWLASLHAQQLGWNRSTSIVDAPGELARYVWDAITLGHAQNLLYLTAVPLAVAALIVLWRSGIRDGMFAYAVIAVVAPLATGSAMSLPRFLMGTFPYAIAGGILLDRMSIRLRAATLALSAGGLVFCMWATYRGGGLAP